MGLKAQDVYAILNSRIEEGGSGGELETVKQTVNEMQTELNQFQSEVEGKYLYVDTDGYVKNTTIPLKTKSTNEDIEIMLGALQTENYWLNGLSVRAGEERVDTAGVSLYAGEIPVVEIVSEQQEGAVSATLSTHGIKLFDTKGPVSASFGWVIHEDETVGAIAVNNSTIYFKRLTNNEIHPEENGYIQIQGVASPGSDYDVANKKYVDTVGENLAGEIAEVGGQFANYLPLSGGTMGGVLNMGGNSIRNAESIRFDNELFGATLTFSTGDNLEAFVLNKNHHGADAAHSIGLAFGSSLGTNYSTLLIAEDNDSLSIRKFGNTNSASTGFPLRRVKGADPVSVNDFVTLNYFNTHSGGGDYLPLTGGTLTGPLTLSGDPTSNNHAATKNYVDDEITEMHDYLYDEFLDITGGTMEGDIDMNNGDISSIYTLSFNHYSSLSGENSGRPLTAFSGWQDSNERNYIMTYKDMAFVDETMDSGSRKNALGFIHYENTEYGGTFRIGFGTRYDQSLGHIIAASPEAPGHVAIKSYVDFYANTFIDEVSISNANFNILEPRVGEDWDMLTVKKILDGETNPNSDYYGLGYIQGSDNNKYLSAVHVNKPYSTASTQTATYELAELKVATPTTDDSAVNKEYADENYVNKSDMDTEQEKLEKMIENYYAMRRTGKVYQTKLWKYNTNPSSTGEKLLDNAELVFEPSTDTTEGQDDYLNGQHPMFEWLNVNYVRDEGGTARPTAIEGTDSYKTSGTVDVGVMQMSFYWKWDTSNAEYDLITVSDTPHPELGLEPWPECVKEDGTVLPWCIGSKYVSGTASDGLLRSQPNLRPENYQSHNNMITNYQLKGEGYFGAGAVRNLFQIVFNAIKGATKNSQTLYKGVTNYNFQYNASVERDTSETYFPVTNEQAANIIVGHCVEVGYGSNNNGELNKDRGVTTMRQYAHNVKVLKIETLDENNKAVYLDIEDGFTTTPVQLTETLSSPIIMSSMHCYSGMTDSVLGKHDGSPISNTDGKYPYRVQGREYAVGGYIIASDVVMDFQSDYSKNVYVAEKGTTRSSSDSTIRSTYKMIGNIPADDGGAGADWWIGDIAVDMDTGAWYPSVKGSSDSQGYGDRCYAGGETTSGTREYLQGGYLWPGSGAGSAYLNCWHGLSWAGWVCLGCD